MGMTAPVINEAAALLSRNSTVPVSSSISPNLPIGVAASILPVRAVGVPSSFHNSFLFCAVLKKPGAMAFTRMPTLLKCTASHCVKLLIAAFAPEYAGIFVSGVYAFILDIFIILQSFLSTISRANSCVGNSVPIKFKLNTNSAPDCSRSKKLLVSASISRFVILFVCRGARIIATRSVYEYIAFTEVFKHLRMTFF